MFGWVNLLFFYHFLWLYYTIYFSIVKQFFILFFILILYFYYHQFFRYFQRINNAINYNISRKFIIGLCCHKETLALKIKTVVPNCLLFSFAVVRQISNSFYFELLLCYLMSAIGMNRQECKHK